MKKRITIFIFALVALFISLNTIQAKEVKLSDLNDLLSDDVNSAYIIGEYLFTSKHTLTLEDIMLSARSIDVKDKTGKTDSDSVYNEMSVIGISKSYLNDDDMEGYWEYDNNVSGTTKIDSDTKLNIKYVDYVYVKEDSKFEVNLNLTTSGKYKTYLEDKVGFEGGNLSHSEELSLNSEGKLSGLLYRYDELPETTFSGSDRTGYYFGFVIKVPNATDATKITIQGKNTKQIPYSSFDETTIGEEGIAILYSIDPKNTNKSIKITVDLDGDGEVYEKNEYTIDYSELRFQEDSTYEVKLNSATAADKTIMSGWGYNSTKNSKLDLSNGILTGKLVEQELISEAFGELKRTGYYFDFTFEFPNELQSDKDKVVVEQLKDDKGNSVVKTFDRKNYDENDNLTILFRFDPETSCEPDGTNCRLYFRIDLDGKENKYLPVVYTIDYSKVTFEKSSFFTVNALTEDESNKFADSGWSKKEGYYTEITEVGDKANTYKVSGLLPIFDDKEWKKDPFNSENTLYYLGLVLKLTNAPESMIDGSGINKDTIDIKFFNDDVEDKLFIKSTDDLNDKKEISILKALRSSNDDGSAVKPTDKHFTITVDLDGNEEEYAPYTVTIDYSDLRFQDESRGNVDFNVLDYSTLKEEDPEKIELDSYKFDAETVKGVTIKENNDQPERPVSKVGITGVIKQQTLNETSGFESNEGYFVPIKIEFPKDENLKEFDHSWTLILNNENGSTFEYKPKDNEYEQGWVMVLFRVYDGGKNGVKSIKYKMDFDGPSNSKDHKGNAFIPYEYEIKYDDLKFETEDVLTYSYRNSNGEKVVPKDIISQNTKYRTFDKWTKDGEDVTSGFVPEKDKDVTLVAHWNLNVDEFIKDLVEDLDGDATDYSSDFTSKFDVTKDGNTITFDIKDATMKLSDMDETTIPGAIAYILEKGEVQEITLETAIKNKTNKKVTFTKDGTNDVLQAAALLDLKAKIKNGAKALFEDVLSTDYEGMTLNKMAVNQSEYKIAVGAVDETVTLTDSNIYTVKFTTNATAVISEEELKNALANPSIKNITIAGDFNVKNQQVINNPVTISSPDEQQHTITAEENALNESIFKINTNSVNIHDLKLTGAKTAITVESSGALTFGSLDLSGNTEAGVEVKSNGTVSGDKLTMSNETYNVPAIRAEKNGTTNVRLTDKASKNATKVTKEKINKYEDLVKDEPEYSGNGDTKEQDASYNYYNYYTDSNHSKIYQTKLFNLEGGYRVEFIRYNLYNEKVTLPSEDGNYKFLTMFSREGHEYNIMGFSKNNNGSTTPSDDTGECKLPSYVIDKDELIATEDATYYNSYCIKLKTGAKIVSDKDAFEAAVKDDSTDEIYITKDSTIDLSTETLDIKKKLTIVGQGTNVTLKVKGINIEASEVFMQRLKIDVNADQSAEALINVSNGANEFTLWQSTVKNTSNNKVKNAIKYSSTKAIADIRWNTFDSNNISESYINIDTALASGTDIYLNTFKALTGEENTKTAAILIKKFAEDLTELDGTSGARIGANTFNTGYGVKFSKEISGQNAFIAIETSNEINVAVEYDDTHKTFENVKFKADYQKVKIKYFKDNIESDTPDGDSIIKFVVQAGI